MYFSKFKKEYRALGKKHGVKMNINTNQSTNRLVTICINGRSLSSVLTTEFYNKHLELIKELNAVKHS